MVYNRQAVGLKGVKSLGFIVYTLQKRVGICPVNDFVHGQIQFITDSMAQFHRDDCCSQLKSWNGNFSDWS